MPPERKYRLGDVLVDQGLITASQLSQALRQQKTTNKRIGKTLVEMRAIDEGDVISALALQLAFNRKSLVRNPQSRVESRMSTHAAETHADESGRRIRPMIIGAAVLLVCVAILRPMLMSPSAIEPPTTGTLVTIEEPSTVQTLNVQPQLTRLSKLAHLRTNNVLIVRSVDVYQSALQKQFIFRSSHSLKSVVQRNYEDDNTVRYFFRGATFSEADIPEVLNDDWVRASTFRKVDGGMEWRFQLAEPGSAKYLELEPTNDTDDYQLVVVIRKSHASATL